MVTSIPPAWTPDLRKIKTIQSPRVVRHKPGILQLENVARIPSKIYPDAMTRAIVLYTCRTQECDQQQQLSQLRKDHILIHLGRIAILDVCKELACKPALSDL